jgi:restriction endonuclease S subunit
MVWVNGAECFGSSKSAVEVRKRLFTEFQFLGAIMVPGQKKVFEHAGIKPIILTFRKPLEGEEVVPHLKIYECDEKCENVKLLMEANDEKLKDSGYVISVDAYKERKVIKVSEKAEVKTLGEVCDFGRGVQLTKKDLQGDKYLVIGGGEGPMGKHNEQNTESNTILMSRMGSAGFISMYDEKVFATESIIKIFPKDCMNKLYLYYLLKYVCNQQLKDIAYGSAQPGINVSNLAKLQIPVPSLEKQEEIVELAKKLENQVNNYKALIDGLQYEIEAIKYCSPFVSEDAEIKTLGDLCDFIPTNTIKTSEGLKVGKYKFYNSSQENTLFTNDPIIDKESIIIGNGGEVNVHYDTKFTPSKHVTVCQIMCDGVVLKYIYYYLLYNKHILLDISQGAALKWINKTNLAKLQIPIIPLEKQLELVEKYKKIDDKRNMLLDNMKEMKELMSTTLERLFTS